MPSTQAPHPLFSLKKNIIFYAVMLCMTLLSILFIDRHLADFIHQHEVANSFTKLLSNIPALLETLAAIALLCCLVPKLRSKLSALVIHLLFTLLLATVIRFGAKALFGRTWPETWVDNNPSWINDRIEAFHPFAEGVAYNSFPSGHALFTFALASTFWFHLPRYRLFWAACMLGVFIGQLSQNYHYLGDLLAGASLGVVCTQLAFTVAQKCHR
ncbi:phosphatase PAP2 family protein [Shewanella woodyi]|uniref:Phosphoesterase PA-phosphatase related n=1 Tax=Shewanella woodyi (strain ATCC 51908 / MS32) TaxID=392500 RepID=B1KD98_SHEWM|nr:phosphatase PAP2 family protein [Shewanella woodyi]ACA87933.1 phosphoesterase PA-phosphatase related [Shewanella woodyi ATCC 51908]